MNADETIADLMRNSGDRLLRLAYQLTHDRASAEDLVQEALFGVYRSWRRRGGDVAHPEAYVRRAVVNEFLRAKRLRSSSEVVLASVPDAVDLARFDDDVTARDAIWQALLLLPPRQRAVLVLRYYESRSDREIAELIGAKEATVRSLAARALSALRGAQLADSPVPQGDIHE